MRKKTGVVVKIAKNHVCIRTVHGQFYNVSLKNYKPNIGDIYTGKALIIQSNGARKLMLLFVLCLIFFLCKNTYDHFKPSTTVLVNIPPIIKIKTNKWDKIIDTNAVGKSGRQLLLPLNLKKQNIDNALQSIIEEAKKQNIINDAYMLDHKVITIYISDNSNNSLNLSSFDKYAKERNLKYKINYNGSDFLDK